MAQFHTILCLAGMLLTHLVVPAAGGGQQHEESTAHTGGTADSTEVSASLISRSQDLRITVTPWKGNLAYGMPLAIRGDTLVIDAGMQERVFVLSDVRSVKVERKSAHTGLPLEIAALGLYAGVLLTGTTDGMGTFLTRENPAWYILAAGLAGGVLLGGGTYVAEGASAPGQSYSFPRDPALAAAEWSMLAADLGESEDDTSPRLTLSFHAAWVQSRGPDGTSTTPYFYTFNSTLVTDFNLFRSARAAYAFSPLLAVGVAIVSLDEKPASWVGANTTANERTSGLGYFAEVVLTPLRSRLPRWIDLRLGAGIGEAAVEYSLVSYSTTGQGSQFTMVDRWAFGAVFHANAVLKTSERFGLGVIADYVLVGGEKRPAVPELGVEEEAFGGGSFGFTMSYYF